MMPSSIRCVKHRHDTAFRILTFTRVRFRSSECTETSRIRVAKDIRTHFVFGANTDVGKTVLCAGLARASLESADICHYIKPLQCGASDQSFVEHHVKNPSKLRAQILFHWQTPTSPHAASRQENQPTSDAEVLDKLVAVLGDISAATKKVALVPFAASSTTWIETAGGVLSPSSSSPLNHSPRHASDLAVRCATINNSWGWSTQADLYQPLVGLSQAVLVGDGRLGGISCTLSALESLIMRGYTVAAIVLLSNPPYDNVSAIREHVSRQVKLRAGTGDALFQNPVKSIVSLPPLPPPEQPLDDWFQLPQVVETMNGLNDFLQGSWEDHVESLETMRRVGRETLWWPFTQHGNVTTDEKVILIDSAHGDNFSVLADSSGGSLEQKNLIDGCASWWTQGVGHGESSLALAAAAAAGRYGHVLFPDMVHEPAIRLSQKLLGVNGPGYGWANRVFFSDDGSTAMEVAIKMGMRTFIKRRGIQQDNDVEWIVCAQQDCYHGDTLGAMDVAEPSIFNQNQHPWYQPKGLFLATPTLGFHNGSLQVSYPPEWGWSNQRASFSSVEEVMAIEKRLDTAEYSSYVDSITMQWDNCVNRETGKQVVIASVVLEPILMGAGGMKFVDPLWQRALMDVAKSRNVPIIFDEVAAGLYRVGVKSCRELLKCQPDIASYAKLLSGGLVPLSVTLASKEVFNAFLGDEKSQALLHGHSYTAHPVGCVSSIHALECYEAALSTSANEQVPLMLFDMDQVKDLSHLPLVQQSFSLGTVLAVTIQPEEGAGGGYAATSRTLPLVQKLREAGVFVRPLGNVIYVMVSPISSREDCAKLCAILHRTIDTYGRELQLRYK